MSPRLLPRVQDRALLAGRNPQKAKDVGITIPERVDLTFLSAKEKGKNLFARAGLGKFKPTVHGEAYLKTTYSVKKGKKTRPGEAAE